MRPLALLLALALGCGSKTQASDATDSDIDKLIADVMAYGDKTVPMMATWGGDCDALADKMLALEPLADSIRARTAVIEADPARKAKLQALKKDTIAKVMSHYEELLKPYGKTTADIDKAEVAIKQLCSSNAKYKDAEQRVGLKVRAHHEEAK
jgi:hypothetical protein